MLKVQVDTSLKDVLSQIKLLNPSTNTMVDVPISFQSDKEMGDRVSYPCISIQYVGLEPDIERETHDWRGVITQGSAGVPAKKRPMPKAYTLMYQINIFSKYIIHDGYLQQEVLRRLPAQGHLEIKLGDDATGYKQTVWCFLDDLRNLDNIKEMKLYHKALTYKIMTGMDLDADQEVPTVVQRQTTINPTNTP